jgi:hypothetical protein
LLATTEAPLDCFCSTVFFGAESYLVTGTGFLSLAEDKDFYLEIDGLEMVAAFF